MPERYEKMRNKFAQTMPLKQAKTKAAKIYSATRKHGELGLHTRKGGKKKAR